MKIKSYIINLAHSIDRKDWMQEQLKQFKELDFHFFNAIDARKMTQLKIETVYDDEKTKHILNRSMVRGEIGVALSQLSVMRQIIESDDYALIMEDDILISPHFTESLNKAIGFINNPEPRIVLFSPIPQYSALKAIPISKTQNRYLYSVWQDASYAACYLINKSACQVISNEYPKVCNVIDNWGYFIKQNKIDIKAVVPHVVTFSKHGLDYSTIDVDKDNAQLIKQVIQKPSLLLRIFLKTKGIYNKYKYKVKTTKDTWYTEHGILWSKF